METLRSTTPNFIRCIKPNEQKRAFYFEPVHVLSQLRACGVLETIKISAAGYPSRTSFVDFAERYRILSQKFEKVTGDPRAYSKAILDKCIKDQDKYQVGKTKIFLRAGQLAFLEKLRSERMRIAATLIQKHARRMMAVKRYKKIKQSIITIQKSTTNLYKNKTKKQKKKKLKKKKRPVTKEITTSFTNSLLELQMQKDQNFTWLRVGKTTIT